MYTRCPHCHTYFKVLAEHIKKAGGKVRCGQCYQVFNSIGNLIEKLPVPLTEKRKATVPPEFDSPPEPEIPPRDPTLVRPQPQAKPKPEPESELEPQPVPPPAPVEKPAKKAARRPDPTDIPDTAVDGPHMRAGKPENRAKKAIESIILSRKDKIAGINDGTKSETRDLIVHPEFGMHDDENLQRDDNLTWGLGVLLLLAFFVLQYSYFYRGDLAQHAELRPWIDKLCEIANCTTPVKNDIRAIKLTRRDITTHPKVDNALLISASIVNNAKKTQPFPIMRIRLSDTVGQTLASRNFNPRDYLDADINLKKGMPPGNPVQINLEILDPGNNAINFEFDFFYPRS